MGNIISTLKVTIEPGKRKETLDLVNYLEGPMSQLPGCMSFRAYQDVHNANTLILVEEWASREDLEKHIGSKDYMKKLTLMELSKNPPEIHFHEVSQTHGMELIKKAREESESSA